MPSLFMLNEQHTLYALFNSTTRKLTTFTFDISVFPESILKNILVKSFLFSELGITDGKINLNRFRWEGDYDSGKLVDVVTEKKAIVTEKEVDVKYSSIFFGKYNYDLDSILFEIILNTEMKTEKGKAMKTFLETLLSKKQKDIDFYKSSDLHIFETREEMKTRQDDAFKIR